MARYNYRDYLTDGRTETEALQVCFDDTQNDRQPEIDLDYASITLTDSIKYSPKLNGEQDYLVQCGRLKQNDPTKNIIEPAAFVKNLHINDSTKPQSQNATNYMHRFNTRRIIFEGGKNQLVMAIQRLSKHEGNLHLNGRRGMLGIWVQLTTTTQNQYRFNHVDDVLVKTGLPDTLPEQWGHDADPDDEKWFTNSTWANSQSNVWLHQQNHHYSRSYQLSQFRTMGTNKTTIETYTGEGATPNYVVYGDSLGATVVNHINLHNMWIETGGLDQNGSVSHALVNLKNMGLITLDSFYSQIPDVKVVQLWGNNNKVVFNNMPNIPYSAKSFGGHPDNKWIFNNGRQGSENVRTRSIWDGPVPKDISVIEGNDITACGSRGISLMASPAYKDSEEGIIIGDNAVDVRHPSWIWRGTNQYNF